MAAIKARIDAGLLLLDDLQLDESDSTTDRYAALSGVKDELLAAKDMTECRLDLIEKVDCSSVGWTAAAFYEKTNGLKLKADSAKLWAEAEKSAHEARKKTTDKAPFRYGPGQSGKYSSFQRSSRGWPPPLFSFFFVGLSRRNSYFIYEIRNFFGMKINK